MYELLEKVKHLIFLNKSIVGLKYLVDLAQEKTARTDKKNERVAIYKLLHTLQSQSRG